MTKKSKVILFFIASLVVSIYCRPIFAGFLDMPEITETPKLKRESLLLDLDIPSVRERDPDPEAGPRLNVREFRIQGLVEYPELGITREEIIKRVEGIRFELMDEGERLESGYTLDELSELSDLIADIERETKGEHVGILEVQKLVFLIRDQRRQRGITLGMIETVADTITRYYRERGFILAKAYIPQQRVRDGVVNLTLLLGTLGEVEVSNNRRYRRRTIQSIFDDVMGKPVTSKHIEEKLFLLNDLPGLSAEGYFEPGSQVGDTKLNINVSSERLFDANIRIDNHGADQTAENRIYGDFAWNNPLGIGDRLFIAGLYAEDPGSTTYGAMRYGAKIFNSRVNLSAGISTNDFVLGQGNSEIIDNLNISGTSEVYDAALSWNLKRSRTRNYSVHFLGEQIESKIDSGSIQGVGNLLNDKVRDFSLGFNYDILQEKKHLLHQGNIRLVSGDIVTGAEEGQDDSFSFFAFDYTLLTFWKLPFSDSETRVIARTSGQYAGKALSSISQFGLAGPSRARGFPVNQFFANDAIYLGVDWIFRSPKFLNFSIGRKKYNDAVQIFLFSDYSYGQSQSIIDGEPTVKAELADIGLGFKLDFLRIRSDIQFAFPVINDISPGSVDDENNINIYFNLQYSF